MTLSLATIQDYFKLIGKIIFIHGTAATGWGELQQIALKKAMAGTFAQNGAADSDLYDDITEAIVPLHTQVKATVSKVDSLQTACVTAVQNLLRKVIAVDLGLASNSSVAIVTAALDTDMVDASGTVNGSGTIWTFMKDNFSWEPNSDWEAGENIPDSYVDDDVIA